MQAPNTQTFRLNAGQSVTFQVRGGNYSLFAEGSGTLTINPVLPDGSQTNLLQYNGDNAPPGTFTVGPATIVAAATLHSVVFCVARKPGKTS